MAKSSKLDYSGDCNITLACLDILSVLWKHSTLLVMVAEIYIYIKKNIYLAKKIKKNI